MDDVTVQLISWRLSAIQAQQAITAKNIANANVAGYKAQKIDFSEQLKHLSEQSSTAELKAALVDVADVPDVEDVDDDPFGDNSVQLDKEIANSTAQSLEYQTLVEGLNHHFGMMQIAISGRK